MDRVGEDVTDNIVTYSLFDDVTLVDITDDSSLLDTALVEVTDGEVIELLDSRLVCSLLDVILVDITDDVDSDSNLLLDSVLVNIMEITSLLEIVSTETANDVLFETDIDNADICSLAMLTGTVEFSLLFVAVLVEVTICTEVSSLFDAAVVEVTNAVDDTVAMPDSTAVNDTDVIAVVLVFDGTLVDTGDNEGVNVILDTALVNVTDGAVVEILVNNMLVCSLLDITPSDITDDADTTSVLDSGLVLFTDGMEATSLLEMILTVVDDVLLETELVNINDVTEYCSVAVLGIVDFSLLFMTVLVEVTTCTDVNIVFDAADNVDVDTVLVAVINCTVKGCSLLGMIFILLTDDEDIIVLSVTEALGVINGGEICSLFNPTLVGTTDVELTSLLVTSIAEATVCAELSSLLSITLVDVPLLLADGKDICSVSATVLTGITVVGVVVNAVTLKVAAADVAGVKVVESMKVCLLFDNILEDVTDDVDESPLLDAG